MKKIMNKLYDKLWKKCVIIFLVIFLIVAVGGVLSVNYLNDAVNNQHIHSERIVVQNKLYGDSAYSDYYIVIGDNNRTYSIVDHGDGYGKKMFDSIVVNNSYEIIVKEPELIDVNQFPHIIQVHNDTRANG